MESACHSHSPPPPWPPRPIYLAHFLHPPGGSLHPSVPESNKTRHPSFSACCVCEALRLARTSATASAASRCEERTLQRARFNSSNIVETESSAQPACRAWPAVRRCFRQQVMHVLLPAHPDVNRGLQGSTVTCKCMFSGSMFTRLQDSHARLPLMAHIAAHNSPA